MRGYSGMDFWRDGREGSTEFEGRGDEKCSDNGNERRICGY